MMEYLQQYIQNRQQNNPRGRTGDICLIWRALLHICDLNTLEKTKQEGTTVGNVLNYKTRLQIQAPAVHT